MNLNVNNSADFDEAQTGDEPIVFDVGQRRVEAEVTVGIESGLVAETSTVRAVHEPAPPRVDRVQTLAFSCNENKIQNVLIESGWIFNEVGKNLLAI